ncbi:anti-phage ZorAB system protein ZorA [Beggiatoa leptomitoformis]|nr:anti-phage ZorAB system protein ZorA [Beggiatoa leptomitoformis]
MDLFFSLINNPMIPWGLALSILLLALSIWGLFRLTLARFERQLFQAQQAIDKIPPSEFINHYEILNEQLQKNPLLAQQWEAFRKTLILPKKPREPIFYTHRPDLYFNETTLIAPRLNLRLYQSAPNIFVGIGLFFTFIGLVAALWFASQGVAAPDIEKAQQALRDLLHAATFKFITSISGLIASIVFSWREKVQLHNLQEKFHIFCHSLESHLTFITLEQVNGAQIEESKRQTEQLERFNTDLAASIANALEDKFSEKLAKAMKPLSVAIDGLADRVGGMNQNALERMVETFSQHLQNAAGEEMKQVAQALEKLIPTLGELRQQFDMSGVDFGSRMTDAASTLQQGFNHAADNLLERMSATTAEINQTAAQELQRVGEPLSALLTAMTGLKQGIDESSNHLRTKAQDAGAALGLAGEKLEMRLSSASQQLATQLTDAADKFAIVRTEMSEMSGQTVEMFKLSLKQLGNIQTQLVETGAQLTLVGQPLSETVQALNLTLNNVKTLSQSMETTVNTLQAVSTSSSESLNSTNKTVEQVWKKYQSHFEKVDEDVAKVFQELSKGVDNYRQQVESFTQKLDESLNNATKSLSSVIVELMESIEDLNNTSAKEKK